MGLYTYLKSTVNRVYEIVAIWFVSLCYSVITVFSLNVFGDPAVNLFTIAVTSFCIMYLQWEIWGVREGLTQCFNR